MATNHWDSIRARDTCIYGNHPNGAHESLTRAYGILKEVRGMLDRGDSAETVTAFIDWAETPIGIYPGPHSQWWVT